MNVELMTRVVRHIAAFRSRPSVRLMEVLYGSQAKSLRTAVSAMILDRKVTGSDKAAGYNECRRLLIEGVGATGNCVAAVDADFERIAAELLTAAA